MNVSWNHSCLIEKWSNAMLIYIWPLHSFTFKDAVIFFFMRRFNATNWPLCCSLRQCLSAANELSMEVTWFSSSPYRTFFYICDQIVDTLYICMILSSTHMHERRALHLLLKCDWWQTTWVFYVNTKKCLKWAIKRSQHLSCCKMVKLSHINDFTQIKVLI